MTLMLAGQVQVLRTSDKTVLGHVAFTPTGFSATRYQDDLLPKDLRRSHAAQSPLSGDFPSLDVATAWVGATPHLPDLADLGLHDVPGMIGRTLWSQVHERTRYSFFGVVRNGAHWAQPIQEILKSLIHRGVVGLLLREPLEGLAPQVCQVVTIDSTYDGSLWLHLNRGGQMGFGQMNDPDRLLRSLKQMISRLRDDHLLPIAPRKPTAHQTLEMRQAETDFANRVIAYAESWDGWRADILARIEAGLGS